MHWAFSGSVLIVQVLLVSTQTNCPPIRDVKNGILKVNILSPTSYVQVVCDPGYVFFSKKRPRDNSGILKCGKNRRWSEPDPLCLEHGKHCLPPNPIKNGKIIQEPPYPVDSSVDYICSSGYVLRGPSERRCQINLEWTGNNPVCVEWSIETLAQDIDDQFVDKLEQHSSGIHRSISRDVELEGLDLILLLDKSSSIHRDDFRKGIQFAKFLVDKFNVSNGDKSKIGGTRLAVFTFATNTKEEFSLNDASIDTTATANRKLDTVTCVNEYCDGGTNIDIGLSKVFTEVTNKARQKAKKVLFITTDGTPTAGTIEIATNRAKRLKEKLNVEIYAAGIGRDVDTSVLSELASTPFAEHVFLLDDFSDFDKIMFIIQNTVPPTPPPPVEQCGYISEEAKKNKKDGNGPVAPGTWPWLAAIVIADSESNEVRFGCSGVLVCQQWVLTNADCLHTDGQLLNPNNVYVFLGATNLATTTGHEQHFYAKKIILREEYDPQIINNKNIALIELNEKAILNSYVRTGCIPERGEFLSAQTETTGTAIGWLMTSEESMRLPDMSVREAHLSQTNLTIMGTDLCGVISAKNLVCNPNMFIAGNSGSVSQKCKGEVGTPFHKVTKNGRTVVLGLAAHTEGCTLNSKRMLYIPLRLYGAWIQEKADFCLDEHDSN